MEGSVDFSDSQLSINLHGVLGKYPFFTVMNTLHFQSERAKLKFGDTNSSDIPYICYTKLASTIFIFFWCVSHFTIALNTRILHLFLSDVCST